jgi:hypothetical protein
VRISRCDLGAVVCFQAASLEGSSRLGALCASVYLCGLNHLFRAQQLNVEDQGGIGRDGSRIAFLPVRQIRRNL